MAISKNLQHILALINQGFKSYGIATSILLSWLMKADGNTSKSELKILEDYLNQFNLLSQKNVFFHIIDEFDQDSLEFASEILRRDLTTEGKRLTMDLFLGMVIADGYITYTEMYVIEFIADLFGYNPDLLNKIFIESTGRPKVKHGNPSSASWWKSRGRDSSSDDQKQKKEEKRKYRQSAQSNQSLSKRQKSLAILGLDESATEKEIKSSFRLLTKIHHPDRFQKLGNEAKRSANQTFIRIKDAYEYLMTQ